MSIRRVRRTRFTEPIHSDTDFEGLYDDPPMDDLGLQDPFLDDGSQPDLTPLQIARLDNLAQKGSHLADNFEPGSYEILQAMQKIIDEQ